MKLLFLTYRYGGRTAVRPLYTTASFFFQGKQPAVDSVILVEMAGLSEFSDQAVQKWIQEHLEVQTRRDLIELPESLWRPAVLDDVLVVENYQWMVWQLSRHFTLADFQDFGQRHLPPAQRQLREMLAIGDQKERMNKLGEIRPFLERVFLTMNQTPACATQTYNEGMKAIEKAQLETLSTFSVATWIETADALYTGELSLRLLTEVVETLKRPGITQEYIHSVLEQIISRPKLRQLTEYAPLFWRPLQHVLRFEGNVTGETIDIAPAKEQTVAAGWVLFEGRRVGRIMPGRAALVLREEDGRITYIGADRKLKFAVSRAGGRLERLGNTLVLGDSDQAQLNQALLTVEQLNALANVDLEEAVRRVENLQLPPDHPVYQAAQAAQTDPRHSRILADLLIELAVGIDADVARRLMRAQSRARRR